LGSSLLMRRYCAIIGVSWAVLAIAQDFSQDLLGRRNES
jgi:hypothetical protein